MSAITDKTSEIVTKINTAKSNLATAITNKGVTTNNSDSFSTMVTNINNIPAGGGLKAGDTIDFSKLTMPIPSVSSSSALGYVVYPETDGYVVVNSNNTIKKYALDGTTQLWFKSLTSSTPNAIFKDTNGYVVVGSNYIGKVSLDGSTILFQTTTISTTFYSIIKEPNDGNYIVTAANTGIYKINSTTGAQMAMFSNSHSTNYQVVRDANGNYIVSTAGGYLTSINNALTAKNWDYNVGHGIIYGFIQEDDGYTCYSYTGSYITKVKLDGSGIFFDYNVGHSTSSKLVKESDGYVSLSTSGYLTKIKLDGTGVVWDCNYTTATTTGYSFVKSNYSYIVCGLNMLLFIGFDGSLLWNTTIAQMSFTGQSNSNGAYSYMFIESDNVVIPGSYRLIKFPADPQFVYKG